MAKAFFIMRLNDHIQYLKKIDAALNGKSDFQGTHHHDCKLGKWLYGIGSEEVAAMKHHKAKEVFDSLFEPHEHFHTIGKDALSKKQAGDADGAKVALTALYSLSATLTQKLLELDKME
jgi:Chemoreceptor zinc-binding domain